MNKFWAWFDSWFPQPTSRMPINKFLTYEKSGAVSVDLDDYLRTDKGRAQLAVIERIRTNATIH